MVKLICGLGNPGPRYEHTRHNLGFDILDRLAQKLDLRPAEKTAWFEFRAVPTASGEVYLVKPLTYVNRSGLAVFEAVNQFKVDPAELFVISDDFHIPLGSLRIRKSGSSGGHNGLESVIEFLGDTDFARMRTGIGPLPEWAAADRRLIPDFVLGRFESQEIETVQQMISLAVEAIEVIITQNLDQAISKYNKTNPTLGQ